MHRSLVRRCASKKATAASISVLEYTSSFFKSGDYAFLQKCTAEMKMQQDTYGQKQNEMERVQRVAKYVGFDLSKKPKDDEANRGS